MDSGRQREAPRRGVAVVAVGRGIEVAHAVTAVEVGPEDDAAVELRPRRDIGEIHRHRLLQVDVERLTRRQDLAGPPRLAPAGLVLGNPLHQGEDVLYADTAGAES